MQVHASRGRSVSVGETSGRVAGADSRRQGLVQRLLASPKSWAVLMLGVVLAGAYKASFGIPLALWHDEAWVATSVLEPSWTEMFFFSRYAQSSPPGYVATLRVMGQAFGYSEPVLRGYSFAMFALAPRT